MRMKRRLWRRLRIRLFIRYPMRYDFLSSDSVTSSIRYKSAFQVMIRGLGGGGGGDGEKDNLVLFYRRLSTRSHNGLQTHAHVQNRHVLSHYVSSTNIVSYMSHRGHRFHCISN